MRREWKTVSRQILEVEELTRDRRRGGERVAREKKKHLKRKRDEWELLSTLSPK